MIWKNYCSEGPVFPGASDPRLCGPGRSSCSNISPRPSHWLITLHFHSQRLIRGANVCSCLQQLRRSQPGILLVRRHIASNCKVNNAGWCLQTISQECAEVMTCRSKEISWGQRGKWKTVVGTFQRSLDFCHFYYTLDPKRGFCKMWKQIILTLLYQQYRWN